LTGGSQLLYNTVSDEYNLTYPPQTIPNAP